MSDPPGTAPGPAGGAERGVLTPRLLTTTAIWRGKDRRASFEQPSFALAAKVNDIND